MAFFFSFSGLPKENKSRDRLCDIGQIRVTRIECIGQAISRLRGVDTRASDSESTTSDCTVLAKFSKYFQFKESQKFETFTVPATLRLVNGFFFQKDEQKAFEPQAC